MNPKHQNPRVPRNDRRRIEYWAYAPYNFVPLPEKIVTVKQVPGQDVYSGYRGLLDCTLITRSPL